MSYDVVQVHIPPSDCLRQNLRILRDVVSIDSVYKAGVIIMDHLLDYALKLGIVKKSHGYGSIINRPDADPFKSTLRDKLIHYPVEVETVRRGLDNSQALEKARNIIEEWPENEDTAIIIDSCIARGTTYVNRFMPLISEMSNSVSRIVYFVLIASEPGLRRIDEASKEFAKRVHVVTAAVDPYVDPNGWICPGVGPSSLTKRVTEKMGVTELWSEYPLDLARVAFAESLNSVDGWMSALDASLIWLIWLYKTNKGKSMGYLRLVRWVQEIDAVSGLQGTEYSIGRNDVSTCRNPHGYNVSSALNRLTFQEIVQYTSDGYVLNPIIGEKYLNSVLIPVLEDHPTYGNLADAIIRFYPKFR